MGTTGNILAVEYGNLTTVVTNGASAYNWQDITNLSKTMTPASASSKFLINYRLSVGSLETTFIQEWFVMVQQLT